MKKFSFSLEKVLAVRELRKLIAEENLAVLLNDMYLAEKALDMSKILARDNETRLRNQLVGNLDLCEINTLLNFREAVNGQIIKRKEELTQKRSLVQEAQQEVIVRNQDMKVIHRLKEKQKSRYMKRYWWEHSKQMDQIGALYFNREEMRR